MLITRNTVNEKVDESTPASFVIRKLNEMGFKVLGEHDPADEHYGFVCYMNVPQNCGALFTKVRQLCSVTKWDITASGNYYDGLRSYYYRGVDEDPEISKSTFFMRMEPAYGDLIVGDFPVERRDYRDYYGIGYERGIFYHTTKRKYVPRILKQGLVPKAGHEITRWRDTKERLYLSTIPDFDEFLPNYTNVTSPELEDSIMLKVDTRGLDIKFYVDESYENAVYTYDCISPDRIEVMECDDIVIRFETKELLDKLVEKYNLNQQNMRITNVRNTIVDHLMKYIGKRFIESVPEDHVKSIISSVYAAAAGFPVNEAAGDDISMYVARVNSCIDECNSVLAEYGLSVKYNAKYNFDGKDWIAVYQRRSVLNGGKIRIGVNFPFLLDSMKRYRISTRNISNVMEQIDISVWHECGHGIMEWLRKLRRTDTQKKTGLFTKDMVRDIRVLNDDEEYYVEQFGAMMAGCQYYSELDDFLTRYGDILKTMTM